VKASFVDKIIQRVQQLGAEDVHASVVRLAREKDFLETIFNCLQDGLIVLDGTGKIEYHNESAARLLGFPDDGAIGAVIGRYLKEIDWGVMLKEHKGARRTLQVSYPEFRVLDFQLIPIEIHGEAKNVFAAIFHDVTMSHRSTQATIESERQQAVTLLAAGVAHELGNPLNSLHIHLQLMERDAKKLPQKSAKCFEESINVAKAEIERLDGIITQFLKALRPTAPNLIPGQLPHVLGETLGLFQAELKNRDIIVEQDVPVNLPVVQFDHEQMKQVFYNIIRNALDAMGQGGILKAAFSQDDEWLSAEFKDSGGGISTEHMAQVGKPYFTTKSSGTGLGLMIVNRIIGDHGGRMEMESQRGVGTTVRIKLPLLQKRVRLLSDRLV